ncbi:hypothetical protein HMPREF1985_00563 [Mitsuokella sp. oral taxon 131 str. W9106]|nr:hypothetical protein HMPREF1985_00563 [Mitsuokella sp. oral taxon 131 str. W9106]
MPASCCASFQALFHLSPRPSSCIVLVFPPPAARAGIIASCLVPFGGISPRAEMATSFLHIASAHQPK